MFSERFVLHEQSDRIVLHRDQGCTDAPSWPQYVFNYLEDHFPNLTIGHNGAVPATSSAYMAACSGVHIPQETDIVFLEYALNDATLPMPPFENEARKKYEHLIRKLLNYPNKPAVILLHSYKWFTGFNKQPLPNGTFTETAERQHGEFALYYDLPELSVKGCCYHLMAMNVTGFQVHTSRDNNNYSNYEGLKNKVFYHDTIHPDGNTGARVMAEMAIHLLTFTMASLKRRAITDWDTAAEAHDPWQLRIHV